ncbi:MAG: signal peptidase II [Deltaproteobacteria bacterium]|nr:signal peptidase II [Deltaproteobacteria bacterium]
MMVWPALLVIVLDQISKMAVIQLLKEHESLTIINGFFNLVHVRNRGIAFGLMSRSDPGLTIYFLLAASLTAVILLLFWLFRLKENETGIAVGLSMILGGAIGNIIDRLRFREVIDFLDFYTGSYHWPAFNLADSAITTGALWLAVNLVFQHEK